MKLNNNLNQLALLLLTLFSVSFASASFASQPESATGSPQGSEIEAEEEQDRWFEIEVIVYKPTSKNGFKDESWDRDLVFKPAENQVDFLQPYYLPSEEFSSLIEIQDPQTALEAETPLVSNASDDSQVAIDNQTTLMTPNSETPAPLNHSIVDIHSLDEEAKLLSQFNQPLEEKPFIPLEKELLQLSNEVASLNRHPEYKVLTHLAWRQPVLGRNEAVNVRIAGGQDFSQYYNNEGNKLISEASFETELDEQGDPLQTNDITLIANDQFPETSGFETSSRNVVTETVDTSAVEGIDTDNIKNAHLISDSDPFENPLLPQLVPQLWVPELDGYIRIYLNRFLHINTHLFLRVPDKEEIEAIDLDLYDPETLSTYSAEEERALTAINNELITPVDQLDNSEEFVLTSPNATFLSEATQQTSLETASFVAQDNPLLVDQKDHQFSWEISDDFLEKESDKMYIERLFNYSVTQSRKVRSGELHFFDHPLMGILIIIRPYELPLEPADNFSPKI